VTSLSFSWLTTTHFSIGALRCLLHFVFDIMTTSTRKSPRLTATPQKGEELPTDDDFLINHLPTEEADDPKKASSTMKKEKKEKKKRDGSSSSEKKKMKKEKKEKEEKENQSEQQTMETTTPVTPTTSELTLPSSSKRRRRRSHSEGESVMEMEPAAVEEDQEGQTPNTVMEAPSSVAATTTTTTSSSKKHKRSSKKDKKEKKKSKENSSKNQSPQADEDDDEHVPSRAAIIDAVTPMSVVETTTLPPHEPISKVLEGSLYETPPDKSLQMMTTTTTLTTTAATTSTTATKTSNASVANGDGNDDDEDDNKDQSMDLDDDPIVPPPTPPVFKSPPTMNVLVHRVRYLQFRPSAILCMAVTPTTSAAAVSHNTTTTTTNTNTNITTTTTTNPPPTSPTPSHHHHHQQQWLAMSRQNGSVELRGVDEKFRVLATVAGLRQKTVDCMTWICGKQPPPSRSAAASSSESPNSSHPHNTTTASSLLIGASNDGTLFHIHFARGQLVNIIPSGGGAIFCLQSLCDSCCNKKNGGDGCRRLVAAGCEDGVVRIFQVTTPPPQQRNVAAANHDAILRDQRDAPQLQLVSTLPSAGAAILSLAWRHFPSSNGGAAGSTILFAGVADGTIRRYDCHESTSSLHTTTTTTSDDHGWTGQWKSSHRMTVECYGRNTPTRVWKLLFLSDGTVVSGDSLGHVQFWDGHTGTLLQGFDQNDCKADVLDLAVSSDETKVFASGVDSRVVCMERTSMTHYRPKWILSHAQRPHTHDVKALAICQRIDKFPGGANPATTTDVDDVLCTGGVDTKICTYLVRKFQKVRPRNLYPWPSQSHLSFATESRILLMRRETKVDLYQLSTTPAAAGESSIDLLVVPYDGNALVGSIEIKSLGNLVCSDISKSGELVAMSDHATLLIFQIQYIQNPDGTVTALPQRVTLPENVRLSCLVVKFASTNNLVAASTTGDLHIMELTKEGDNATTVQVRLLQTLRVKQDSFFPVDDVCVSSNHRWIATIRNGSGGAGTIHVFRRSDDGKDSYQHWWSIPELDAPNSTARFVEDEAASSTTMLAVACCNFALYMFDVQKKSLSPWSEANGFPVSHVLPQELKHRNDVPVRIAYNPVSPQKVLVVSRRASRSGELFLVVVPLECWKKEEARKNVIPARIYLVACWLVTLAILANSTLCNERTQCFRPQELYNVTLWWYSTGLHFLIWHTCCSSNTFAQISCWNRVPLVLLR
jgi:U3 small nucleolar RNA-associated protein 4